MQESLTKIQELLHEQSVNIINGRTDLALVNGYQIGDEISKLKVDNLISGFRKDFNCISNESLPFANFSI